jgi:hypothetical protein
MFLDLTGFGVAANEFLVRFVALSATAIGVFRPTAAARLRTAVTGLYRVCYRRSEKRECRDDSDERESCFIHGTASEVIASAGISKKIDSRRSCAASGVM